VRFVAFAQWPRAVSLLSAGQLAVLCRRSVERDKAAFFIGLFNFL
jgi:hypothetical protein